MARMPLFALALTACTTDAVTDAPYESEPAEALTDVSPEVDALLASDPAPDALAGFDAAAEATLEEVATLLGEDAVDDVPDLVAVWESETVLATDDLFRDADGCHVAAAIGGAWADEPGLGGPYAGGWFAPDGTRIGGLHGSYRNLALPGGQWGGALFHAGNPAGPQGGMFDRFEERFGGLWSTPRAEHQGRVAGHWVRLNPQGGFFFGAMTVCR